MADYDVVVVGGGGTGLMAAYAAAREGCSVVLLEKGAQLGGMTALAVGTVTAAGTTLQRAAGILDDSPDLHFEDLAKFAGPRVTRDNLELRRILVDNAPETIELLTKLGVVFMGPLPEPPHRHPRLHAIIPHAFGFIRRLARACRAEGVVIRTRAPVKRLLQTDGRVTGVEVDGGPSVGARRGVILASGDFSSAELDYKSRLMNGPLLDIGGIYPLSCGDGQRMGEAVGSEVINGDLAWGPEIRFRAPPNPSLVSKLPTWPVLARLILNTMKVIPDSLIRPFMLGFVTTFLAPSPALFRAGAILINSDGRRFCDERERPQDFIGKQPGKSAWIVFGGDVARQFNAWPNYISTAPGIGFAYLPDYERSRPDVVHKSETLDALARSIGVPEKTLAATVVELNSGRAARDDRAVLTEGPFYALGPAISWIVFTEGGLKIDTSFRVLRRDGQQIEGLYAAGSAGQGGVLLEGHGHHLAWAFTSGRLAGRSAALGNAAS